VENQKTFSLLARRVPQWRIAPVGEPRRFTAVGALAALCVVLAFVAPGFASPANLANVMSQSTFLLVLSVGQMLVIVTRGFDISVGPIAVLSSMVAAQVALRYGDVAAIVAVGVTGLVFGCVNGYLIAYRRIEPVVATLGTALVVRGLATATAAGGDAVLLPKGSCFHALAYASWFGVPALVVFSLPVVALGWLIAMRAPLGRWFYMIGSNPDASVLVGVPVKSAGLAAYALCGAFSGVAGLFLLARSGSAVPVDGNGVELQSIAACVIGGVSLMGGSGRVWQVVAGTLFIQALLNGLNLAGASPFLSELVLGLIILMSGVVDFLVSRLRCCSVTN
jgi:ribose/xylose/arabinose/galactoside ABC-type transport system permease subunit